MAAVIPAVTKISPRVIRILGCNPGIMTLQGTNTYIVGTGKRRILIDTGDEGVPQYLNHLRSVLNYEGIDLAHIFITHWHHDHIGGLNDILVELKEKTRYCQIWKYPSCKDDINKNEMIEPLKDGQEFAVEGATLQVFHTPGHTDDHVVLHLVEDNVIFSGDCILGEGTAVFEDLFDYMNSLKSIANLNPTTILPGHGNVIQNPSEKISFYLAHRAERESQIIQTLNSNRSKSFNEEDLVRIIYVNLPENLVKSAQSNVNHHLVKLLREQRVKKLDDRWQACDFNEVKSR
ncbi:beta-lactamase-like protein 2 homolog [Diorhabda carinulata]|uniref:beta-lactamase-like protein 2 homolog n=1 Tax=Diorhabda sublineata TaxID=1163346 RepID=UPI0024E12EC4|nr:beta-lactamase-like protein 2 homolog [Diorhabda sublineata]XP_056644947.1 beta-lactamase-like protein 2 homolog [Diorhabda sublineata]XP_056644948.1 beta-lactamase-like protein 2 homolog [Diorhabda sublineata]XP_057666098.1 beta-lactamase-like protein 2 homolog [Diorhabda carinulata]XP_057666099.1 beta-lactamase-like protein 2 homolog [Diorhabda carinulata]